MGIDSVVKNQALNQQIYTLLKQEILHHQLQPGERIVDAQVAARLGVSRTPAREAIFQLSRTGLVEKRANGGFYVVLPERRDIDEMYEVRKMIEREAVRKNISTMQTDDGTMAQKVAAWRDRYFADLQSCPFSQADTEMHEGMIALTGNRHLVKFYRECCNQMELFRQKTEECENRIEKARTVHQQLIESICAQDVRMAESIVDEHLNRAVAEAYELLDEQQA